MRSGLFEHPGNNGVLIRLATDNDIPAIADITKLTYGKTFIMPGTGEACFSEHELEMLRQHAITAFPELIKANKCKIYVACRFDKVIGYAKVDLEDKCSLLDRIYILPSEQGSGAGNLLLQACFQFSLTSQINKMRLEVWDQNELAIAYYLKNKFIKTDKKHTKTNADGKIFHGFEMVCNNVSDALTQLSAYLASKSEKPFKLTAS